MAPILLLDGFSLFYRAFYGLPAMTTAAGEPTSAVYGLSMLLLKLLREVRPKGIAFALDAPVRTFRHAMYDDYKATRVKAPSALGAQLGRFDELIAALGAPAFRVPGFEGDDVLATLARELREAGEHPLVVSGDNDCLQLVRAPTRVMIVPRGKDARTYDEAAIAERFGVTPAQLPERSALVGDVTDNLPGVAGIGGKTASDLVRRFGTVAEILRRIDEVTPPRARAAILEAADRLPLLVELSRLRDDVPLSPGPRFAAADQAARDRVRKLFEALEFRSLLARIDAAF